MIGILGGGQLGRMLALSGYPLGLQFRVLDTSGDAPAGHMAGLVWGAYEDKEILNSFASGLDSVTYEFENVPVGAARYLEGRLPVFPPSRALEVSQDRLFEKQLFQKLGIPTAPFAPVESKAELTDALHKLGAPSILKTRRGGYDGKGQLVIKNLKDAAHAWHALGGVPLILEGFVNFRRELSILAVRSKSGPCAFYPLAENHHREGILRLSLAPAPRWTKELQTQAVSLAKKVLNELQYVGVLAIELFETPAPKGKAGSVLVANEMAPRVHNSGHWSIEGAQTSQFENHLRAGLGWPLGSCEARGQAAMVNLIGNFPELPASFEFPNAHWHLYGKAPRAGRKIGHVTLCETSVKDREQALKGLYKALEMPDPRA